MDFYDGLVLCLCKKVLVWCEMLDVKLMTIWKKSLNCAQLCIIVFHITCIPHCSFFMRLFCGTKGTLFITV